MANVPSPSGEFFLHLESAIKPHAHREFMKLAMKAHGAYAAAGHAFSIYETLIGDANVVHRFAHVSDFSKIGGREVQHDVIAQAESAQYLDQHLTQAQQVVLSERFSLLRYQEALSNPGTDGDPDLLLLMRTQLKPGNLHKAMTLMERTANSFRSHHAAKFTAAVTLVGDVNSVFRFSPLGSLSEIGGFDVLTEVLAKSNDAGLTKHHLEEYGSVVDAEEFSVLRKVS